jgi:glycosyltransferase involved in cell wall biosynthesis
VEIRVVANGCTDATAAVAASSFVDYYGSRSEVATFVHDLRQAGKANAWNYLVHEAANRLTEFIFLVDADIRIPDRECLAHLLQALRGASEAHVAVDEPRKDLQEGVPRKLLERFILAGSGTAYEVGSSICGQLYCARFGFLKNIMLPLGLPGEDGYLNAVVRTSNFQMSDDPRRIVFANNAFHVFESDKTIGSVFRHNLRLTIGTAINILLFDFYHANADVTADLSNYVRNMNETNPKWINRLIESKKGRFSLVGRAFLTNRIKRLSALPLRSQLRRGPKYAIGVLFDLVLYIVANRLMRKGVGAGFW